MELPTTFKHLVKVLEMRKSMASKPYTLLLSSSVSLTPSVFQTICRASDWVAFRQYMHDLGPRDRLIALSALARTPQHCDGYRALARLILQGYFSIILTTNIDADLEQALMDALHVENHPSRSFQLLVLGRDTDEHIMEALDYHTDGICVIKLHGSLRDGVIPTAFPDFFTLPSTLSGSIQRYLNQDLIIVGSIEHDDDLYRSLTRSGKSGAYYVLPDHPAWDDRVVKLIRARGKTPDAYVIAGQYGTFDTFFMTLEALLLQHNMHCNSFINQLPANTSLYPAQHQLLSPSAETPPQALSPLSVYISHAPEDEHFCLELEKQLASLQHQGLIRLWQRSQLKAGEAWKQQIATYLMNADLILQLLSPDFLASEYCYGTEMKMAQQRQEQGNVAIIVVLLRPTAGWQSSFLEAARVLPKNEIPVSNWPLRDQALAEVAEGVREVIEKWKVTAQPPEHL